MKSRVVLFNGLAGFIFLMLASMWSTGQTRTNSVSATIEGTIVRSGTASPLENVVVTLTPEIRGPRTSSYSSPTGKAGDFVISGLPGGRYTVTWFRNGFIMPRITGSTFLDVASGQSLKGVQLEMTETGSIIGRVLDENGNPKSKVQVKAVQAEYVRGRRIFSPCYSSTRMPNSAAETNERGEFRLFGLDPGEYLLATSGRICETVPQYYPGVIDPADAAAVRIGPGAEVALNFRLRPLETHSVHFKVLLDGAQTEARSQDVIMLRGRSGDALEIFTGYPKSGDGGSFVTPGLPSGIYDIYHSTKLGWGNIGHLTVTVGDRDVDGGSMTIHASAAISGQLHVPGNLAIGPASPRPRVYLRAMDVIEGLDGMLSPFRDIENDGKFVLSEVAERSYKVEVTRLPPDMYVASATYRGRNVLDSGFSLEGGAEGPLDIKIDVGGSVNGTVRSPKGDPIANGQIVLIPGKTQRGNFTLFKTAITDSQGKFAISGVAPGEYGVLAFTDVPQGAWANEEFLKEFEGRAIPVSGLKGAPSLVTESLRMIPRTE